MKYYLAEDSEYKEVDMARLKAALEEAYEKSWNEAWRVVLNRVEDGALYFSIEMFENC
nr:MAG TPA: hypothetical protein [Caudoviricetes sp.]